MALVQVAQSFMAEEQAERNTQSVWSEWNKDTAAAFHSSDAYAMQMKWTGKHYVLAQRRLVESEMYSPLGQAVGTH